jgi:purine-binding chemotaxis protein CheW
MSRPRRTIDWEGLRRRLAAVDAHLARGSGLPEGRRAAILDARAARLAARRGTTTEDAGASLVLAFRTGGERYGLALTELAEVAPLPRWTPLPGAPAEHLGLIDRRGEIQPVADLARLLGLPVPAPPEAGYVLTLRLGGRSVGLRVDAVEAVVRLPAEPLAAPPSTGPTTRFARGVSADGLTVLAAPELASHPVFKEPSR